MTANIDLGGYENAGLGANNLFKPTKFSQGNFRLAISVCTTWLSPARALVPGRIGP